MCFTHEVHFETNEVGRIMEIADSNEMKPGDCFELSAEEYSKFAYGFKLDIPVDAELGEIFWRNSDDFDRRPTHTGRELLLMLEGKKPFAAFVDSLPTTDPEIIPERLFDPHVAAGRFIKREAISTMHYRDNSPLKIRRVMYAIVGEEWRISAFLALWKLGEKYNWNERFERFEGYLYGYEPEIDDWFGK